MHDVRDFVISVHALERFEERFPELWTNIRDVGELIHREAMDALEAGRASHVAPLELASYDVQRWKQSDGLIVWEPTKIRGYVLVEAPEGTLVTTVLKGVPTNDAKRKLRKRLPDAKKPRP